MTSPTKSASITNRVIGRFSDWLGWLRDAADIRALSAAEIDSIAHDLRVSRAKLETLVSNGRQTAAELPRLLKALGIDETTIVRKPGVLRDMRLVCALCVAKSRCNTDLDEGTARLHYREYCANSDTIDVLKVKR
jgi:hypothetical protein